MSVPKTAYDPADNSRRGYDLAIKAMREIRVRRNEIAPKTPQELEQQMTGPKPISQLDCVRGR